MRVTKIIREYVEETIGNIYNPLIEKCSGDYYKKKNKMEEILDEMTAEFDATAKRIIEENGFSIDLSWGGTEKKRIIEYHSSFGKAEYMPITKETKRLVDERNQKIKDVLVSLELGGTKDELDEMLKKIKEEVVE